MVQLHTAHLCTNDYVSPDTLSAPSCRLTNWESCKHRAIFAVTKGITGSNFELYLFTFLPAFFLRELHSCIFLDSNDHLRAIGDMNGVVLNRKLRPRKWRVPFQRHPAGKVKGQSRLGRGRCTCEITTDNIRSQSGTTQSLNKQPHVCDLSTTRALSTGPAPIDSNLTYVYHLHCMLLTPRQS